MRYAVALAVLALTLLAAADSTRSQADFFQPCATVEVEDPTPGAPSSVTRVLGIGIGVNCTSEPGIDNEAMYMFSEIVQFTPQQWGVKRDADVVDGTQVGTATWNATFGLLNNACDTTLPPLDFTYFDATTDQHGPRIDPLPPGTADRMAPLGEGSPPAGATAWPTYLDELYPNADWSALRARYLGLSEASFAGNVTVILNILVFEPGATVTDPGFLDSIMGYPSFYVLQDPTAPAGAGDLINDFCSPLLMRETLTDVVLTNPPDGTYPFNAYSTSQRDADGDGFENGLDTCNGSPNVGDPRQNPDPGDPDRDGLDAACDPDPAAGHGTCAMNIGFSDQDEDTWCNRSDNCPLNANPDQADSDRDAIGDACDSNPATPDGFVIPRCVVTDVVVGDGGPRPFNPLHFRPCDPVSCLAGADTFDPRISRSCACPLSVEPEAMQLAIACSPPSPTPTLNPTTTPIAVRTPAAFPATGGQSGGPATGAGFALIAILAAAGVAAFALVRRIRTPPRH